MTQNPGPPCAVGVSSKPEASPLEEKKKSLSQPMGSFEGPATWKSMGIGQKWRFLTRNITVEPMVACYIMPSVLASLAIQSLNLEKACRVNLGYSDEICRTLAARNTTGFEEEEKAVQHLVAGMQTWKTALQSGVPTLLILFMGAWSDRTGLRKPCMLLPIIGEFITSISLFACVYWFYELPMEFAGVSEALWPALTGGWFTMFMAIFSYIGDITTVDSRTLRIGAVNVFLSLGVPIGTALSGILYLKLGFYGVFAISTACYVMAFVYGLVILKEVPRPPQSTITKPKQMSVCASVLDFFSIRHVNEIFRVAFKEGANNRRQRVIILMIVVMVVTGPTHGEMSVVYLSVRYRFNWNEVKFSLFSTYSLVTTLIGTMVSVGLFSHVLKIDDALVGLMSCMSKVLAAFVYAFATEDWMMYLAPLVDIISGTSFIAMRSIASKLVPADELGKVNSLFGVCESLMPLVYGPMYSSVYAATMDTFPGTFYLLGGGLTLPAIFSFLWLYKEHRRDRALLEKEMTTGKCRKAEERINENGVSLTKISADCEKPEKPTMEANTGITNPAFVSEHL